MQSIKLKFHLGMLGRMSANDNLFDKSLWLSFKVVWFRHYLYLFRGCLRNVSRTFNHFGDFLFYWILCLLFRLKFGSSTSTSCSTIFSSLKYWHYSALCFSHLRQVQEHQNFEISTKYFNHLTPNIYKNVLNKHLFGNFHKCQIPLWKHQFLHPILQTKLQKFSQHQLQHFDVARWKYIFCLGSFTTEMVDL